MRWGGIQKLSRPITTCHWMSHWTPQLETTFAPRSPHSTAIITASSSACAPPLSLAGAGVGDARVREEPPLAVHALGDAVAEAPAELEDAGRAAEGLAPGDAEKGRAHLGRHR